MNFKLLALLFLSPTVFAIDRIECNGSGVDLGINYWGSNTSNTRVVLNYRDQNGRWIRDQFTMFKMNSRSSTLRFSSAGRSLEIDIWPDAEIRALRRYSAIFRDQVLGFNRISCIYRD